MKNVEALNLRLSQPMQTEAESPLTPSPKKSSAYVAATLRRQPFEMGVGYWALGVNLNFIQLHTSNAKRLPPNDTRQTPNA